MIKPQLYEKTVGILVDAYFKDTLIHGNCYACAVGNLIAANSGYSFCECDTDDRQFRLYWSGFISYIDDRSISDYSNQNTGLHWLNKTHTGLMQIQTTGYSEKEIELIESAFESVVDPEEYLPMGSQSEDEAMFNGLMAVIEVLDQIHENTDTTLTATTKQRFVKA